MTDQQGLLSGSSGLITATIKQKQQTYHLVTEESLKAIKEKSIVADILMLVTSLLFGAFFSVLIAINASANLPNETLNSLTIYQWVFFWFGCIFLVMTVVTVVMGNRLIGAVTKSEATITSNSNMQQP